MDRLLATGVTDLPDTVTVTERMIKAHFQTWIYWQALEGKFLPSEIEKQSFEQLSTILYLDNIFNIMKMQDAENGDE